MESIAYAEPGSNIKIMINRWMVDGNGPVACAIAIYHVCEVIFLDDTTFQLSVSDYYSGIIKCHGNITASFQAMTSFPGSIRHHRVSRISIMIIEFHVIKNNNDKIEALGELEIDLHLTLK